MIMEQFFEAIVASGIYKYVNFIYMVWGNDLIDPSLGSWDSLPVAPEEIGDANNFQVKNGWF